MGLLTVVIVTIFFLVVSYSVVTVSGQVDSSCRAANRAAVPTNWRVLLDSNDYSFLFQSPSPSWLRSDVDGDGMQFSEIGGLCTRVLNVCPSNFAPTGNEDNWVFTSYTSYGSAKEIFVNVTYSYPACFGNCHPYVTLYRYDTSVPVPAGRTTTSNYQLLTGSDTTSRFGSATTTTMIQETGVSRPSSFAGFYLGIRDTGTCGFPVQRMVIYYKVCEAKTGELVTFPEEALPLESAGSGVYSGSCVLNASAVTSLMVDINSVTGSCTERATGGGRCECDAGYYRVNGTFCGACTVGQYRASTQSQTSCRSCPLNSEARVEGSAVCQCLAGHYRDDNPQEGPEMPCSQPPGPVGNLVSVSTTSGSVTISWDRPSSLGGRTDYYYSIEHSDPRGSASSTITANSRLEDANSRVTYTVTNLLPFETYNIRVIAHNGVSDQENSTAGSRTRAVDATTSEAAPGPVVVTNLCSVVIWQAPAKPNGIILGYEIEIGSQTLSQAAANFFFITMDAHQEANVVSRVRAFNTAGRGPWSMEQPICPVQIVDRCGSPISITAINSTSASLQWSRPSSVSGNMYDVKVSSGAMETQYLVTDSRQMVSYTVSNLNPLTSYTVNVTIGNSSCLSILTTLEGIPGSVSVTNLCSAVLWQAPSRPNGEITGYDVQIGTEIMRVPSKLSYITTTETQREANVITRVRAVNGAGIGPWSLESVLCPGRCSSPITVSSINSSYVSFQWVRDLSNHYQVVITSNSSTAKTYQVTSSQATISYQIFGLMPFTSYTVNITGESSSCLKTITTSEDVPDVLDVTNACSAVLWEAPSNPKGNIVRYDIEIGNDIQMVPATRHFLLVEQSHKEANSLTRVRAVTGAGAGAWSRRAPVCPGSDENTIAEGSCSSPISTTAFTSTSASLQWSRPSSISGNMYEVKVINDAMETQYPVTDSGQMVSYNVSNLHPFTSYTVNVTIGTSSCLATFTTSEEIPGSVLVTNLCSAVLWQAPSRPNGEITGYDVQIGTGITRVPSNQSYMTTTETQREANVLTRVRAVNGAGSGPWSSQESVLCPGRCSSPITVSAINSSHVRLQWVRDLSNHYQVVIASNSNVMTYQVTSEQATISYQISGLMPFTSYTVNITGESSSCLNAFTTSEDVPDVLDVTNACSAVLWEAPSNPKGNIVRYEIEIGNAIQMVQATKHFLLVEKPLREANILIRVRAVTGAGAGAWSRRAPVCPGRCSFPITVSAINSSYVSLQWVRDLSNNYQVVIASNSNVMTYEVTSDQATISYQISGLIPFTSYTVNITGELSSCLTAFTTSEDVPDELDVTSACSAVIWEVPRNPKGIIIRYEIEIGNTIQMVPATQHFHIIEQLLREANILTRVRAVTGAGFGAWSRRSPVCPEACSVSVVQVTNTSVNLRWSRPASGSSDIYEIFLLNSTRKFQVTDVGSHISFTIPDLEPFTFYTVKIMKDNATCTITFKSLEGVPTQPTNFKPFCNLISWKAPLDPKGILIGYEINIKSPTNQEESKFLGPADLVYEIKKNQRKADTKIRLRANNTAYEGTWTQFFSLSCEELATGSSSSGILSSVSTIDVLIIIFITVIVCLVAIILLIATVYIIHKNCSKRRGNTKVNNDLYLPENELKL